MRSRDDLKDGEAKIETFLTHLAVDLRVSSSTQNQAMNALVFLYKHILKQPLDNEIKAERAPRQVNIPVVLTREEVAQIIALMTGIHQLLVKLLYGSGLRVIECLRLRVQDIDFAMKSITARDGKGAKDRVTTFPTSLTTALQDHLTRVKLIREQDLKAGHGEVYMPHALARSTPMRQRIGDGSMHFPPGTFPLIPAVATCGVIIFERR